MGFYWYERDPQLLEVEKKAMRESFPHFKLEKLDDGRLCWVGTLQPCENDIIWTVMAVYENNHPSNSTYGGSIKIYSIDPDLEELNSQAIRIDGRRGLPHVFKDSENNLCICTSLTSDFMIGNVVTSASASLRWAAKWTFLITCWLNGDIEDNDMFGGVF